MPTVTGKPVGPIGYGLMRLTWRPVVTPQEQGFKAMKTALENGANLWNGGEFYGTQELNSLHYLRDYFTEYPEDAEKVVLCIKGGIRWQESGGMTSDASEENVRRSVDKCLKLLGGKKFLDIYECGRVDPKTPIEVTIGALAKCVQEGKIGGIGLSEVKAETIRRAHKVHPIAQVEVELSLWSTDVLYNGVAATCAELGIVLVAYSPLGKGFLTGQIKKPEDLPENDSRRHFPRFQPENFFKNLELVTELEKLAEKRGHTPGQVGLAWVKAQSNRPGFPTIIPIPGATSASRVAENTKEVTLSAEDLNEIDDILSKVEIVGTRYPPQHMAFCDG